MGAAAVRPGIAGPAAGFAGQLVLLALLAGSVGLGGPGLLSGIACAVGGSALVTRGVARAREPRLGPASTVTLTRATLAIGVAALVADSFARATPVALLVALATVALALDLLDGRVARVTGHVTALGARLDGEVDAFLIAALSVYVAPEQGAWVLAIGAARYAFLLGEWLLPWMRAPLPPRRWRKVVAAAQGVVLTVAAADVLSHALTQVLLALALAGLAASVGECTWWLWHRRESAAPAATSRDGVPAGEDDGLPRRGRARRVGGIALTVLAAALVWAALVVPARPDEIGLAAFARLPLELIVVTALALLLPARPRRALVIAAGVALSLVALTKALDMGFFTAFDRPVKPVDDLSYVAIGIETLGDAIGRTPAHLVAAVVGLLALAVLILPVLALRRVVGRAVAHRAVLLPAVAVLALAWVVLRIAGAPVATNDATTLAADEVSAVRAGLQDQTVLAQAIATDRFKATPADRLLSALRGKDVLLVFVESYGRVALEGSSFSPGVVRTVRRGDAQLEAAGFHARSAFLTSPTFGGLSWLAHSTLQSGIRVDGQRRYDHLVDEDRLTLTRAFERGGWRAVGLMPANHRAWPEGHSFYGYDKIYDRRNLGYRGPDFGLPPMPDQYALQALYRRELAPQDREPLFAEVDLISSHAPWTRIPRVVPWSQVGTGAIFGRVAPAAATKAKVFGDARRARKAYGQSIEYSLRSLFGFVGRYGDDDTVLVVLGDHQPATTVSGADAGHDVPISVIARDPAVLQRIAPWRWEDGVLPSAAAPVWPMQAFRDRFFSAYSSR